MPVPMADARRAKIDPRMAPIWMGANALWKKFLSFLSMSALSPVFSVVSIA